MLTITIYLKAQTDQIFNIPCTNTIKTKKNHVPSMLKISLIMHYHNNWKRE